MNVSLTPALERMVAERLASGRYASTREVIREALQLLEERDRLDKLRQEIRLGLDQLDQGRRVRFDDEVVERIKKQGRKRAAAAERKGRQR